MHGLRLSGYLQKIRLQGKGVPEGEELDEKEDRHARPVDFVYQYGVAQNDAERHE